MVAPQDFHRSVDDHHHSRTKGALFQDDRPSLPVLEATDVEQAPKFVVVQRREQRHEPKRGQGVVGQRGPHISISAILATAVTGVSAGCVPFADGPPHDAILLVTVHGLAAADLGHWPPRHPRFEEALKNGRHHVRAIAPSTSSFASLASIHTGVEPHRHGHRAPGAPLFTATLAQRLELSGWHTEAVVVGLDMLWPSAFGREVTTLPSADAAIDWLHRGAGRAARFTWVHLATKRPDHNADGAVAVLEAWLLEHPGGLAIVAGDVGLRADGTVPAAGMILDDATLNVPLAVFGRGSGVVDSPVGAVDIAPTVLAAAGLAASDLDGVDLGDGGSPTIHSEALAPCAIGLAPLHAWTDVDGRWTSGVWGVHTPSGPSPIAGPPPNRKRPPDNAPVVLLQPDQAAAYLALGEWPLDPSACVPGTDPRDAPLDIADAERALLLASAGLPQRAASHLAAISTRHPDAPGPRWLASTLLGKSPDRTGARQHNEATEVDAALRAGRWEDLAAAAARAEQLTGDLRFLALSARAEFELEPSADPRPVADALDRYGRPDLSWTLRAAWSLAQGDLWDVHDPPDDPEAQLLAARAAWDLGQIEAAMRHASDAAQRSPEHVPLQTFRATVFLELDRPADALRALSSLPKRRDIDALRRRATAALPPPPPNRTMRAN